MRLCWNWSRPCADRQRDSDSRLGRVGKTTLARGLVEWLATTEGLGERCFWFTFNDIRSSEYVFNRLVEALFGTDAMAADLAQKASSAGRGVPKTALHSGLG